MINCNPETVSTDYDTSDRLYFEPLTFEDVSAVLDNERPDGVLVQFGGQTPLKLARALEAAGYPIWGTSPESIDLAEDRGRFGTLLGELGLAAPRARGGAQPRRRRWTPAGRIGYPLVVRPSYVLGGRAMAVVFDESAPRAPTSQAAVASSGEHPVLIDRFLDDAVELDVDALCDGTRHLDRRHPAAHRGGRDPLRRLLLGAAALEDAAAAARGDPRRDAPARRRALRAGPRQHPVRDPARQALRPRGQPARLAHGAVRLQGDRGSDGAARRRCSRPASRSPRWALPPERDPVDFFIKGPVFPFRKFPGEDVLLGPEMKSTGEVMGISPRFGDAFAKACEAVGHAAAAGGPGVSDRQSVRQGSGDPDRTGARRTSDSPSARRRGRARRSGRPASRPSASTR